jgi:glycerophosphoryl diester phosphodiesterase
VRIIAHRGLWRQPEDKNTVAALRRALEAGFGIETDLRDHDGRLVIAHDPASDTAPLFEEFLAAVGPSVRDTAMLALNVKSDGLQPLLTEALRAVDPDSVYVFDMSVPDTLGYLANTPAPVFVRQSEHETEPVLYEAAAGVWLDAFERDWYGPELIHRHLDNGKIVAVVSPELHHRPYQMLWEMLRQFKGESGWERLQLCTDHPDAAREFFND